MTNEITSLNEVRQILHIEIAKETEFAKACMESESCARMGQDAHIKAHAYKFVLGLLASVEA